MMMITTSRYYLTSELGSRPLQEDDLLAFAQRQTLHAHCSMTTRCNVFKILTIDWLTKGDPSCARQAVGAFAGFAQRSISFNFKSTERHTSYVKDIHGLMPVRQTVVIQHYSLWNR